MGLRAAVLTALVLAACGPARIRYTLRIESDPPGARVYDPRSDELVGQTPLEMPVEYRRDAGSTYLRMQTALDRGSPRNPETGRPREVSLNGADSVRVLVAKDGYEKAEESIDWFLVDEDGRVVTKHVFLRPMAREQGAADDVYR